MISNLQLIRGLAALAVVFYHSGFVIPGLNHTDFQAVAAFFVISGFIMTYITRKSADGFLTHRIIRIVPLYWAATLFFVLWTRFGFYDVLQNWAHPTNILVSMISFVLTLKQNLGFFTDLGSSLLFVPRFDATGGIAFPLLGVGWTLNLEMFFYVVFAVMLVISRRWAPALTAIFLWAFIQFSNWQGCGLLCAFYAHWYVQFFIYGIAAFYAWQALERLVQFAGGRTMALVLGSLGVVAYLGLTATSGDGIQMRWYQLAAPAMLVLGALALHSADVRCDWKWVDIFGGASYALYLTHVTVLETIRPLATRWPVFDFSQRPSGVLVLLTSCLLFAALVHLRVELPVVRALRRRFVRSKAEPPNAELAPQSAPSTALHSS